ncbi:hypothetical protein [Streptomyces sp. NPDC002133]|uniref:hypothetical protein n=1 Tax=Streptomyces sp. NPDC002133 TaxID=3154409 RepID=UPI00332093AE
MEIVLEELSIDRDEVEDALTEAFAADGEITGAGSGMGRSHLDLEVAAGVDRGEAVERARAALAALGIEGSAEITVRD